MRVRSLLTLALLSLVAVRPASTQEVGANLGDANKDLVFTPIPPCRAAISAVSVPAGGSTALNYRIRGTTGFEAQGGTPGGCGIPSSAAAISVNYTVASPSSPGHIVADPTHLPESSTSTLNFSPTPAGLNLANGVITPLCDLLVSSCTDGDIRVTVHLGSTLLITDVTGYFAPPPNFTLVSSTATEGNIFKGGNRFIHNFGTDNTFIGVNSGNFTMTGLANTAIGSRALSNNGGSQNTASGFRALESNTIGGANTASGYRALGFNKTGFSNTASGSGALAENTTGGGNTASGDSALAFNTTGNGNTAIGMDAMGSNTTGNDNTAIGRLALFANQAGSGNIAIGVFGGQFTTGSNNINIGNIGPFMSGPESGTIGIGTNGTHTKAFVAGIRGVTTAVNNAIPVLIDSNGQLGTVSSSRRFKDDIADMAGASDVLMKLRPVTFHYKSDQDPTGRRLQYGLIAEEVAALNPGLVARSTDGQVETVLYQFLPPMLLNEVQKQQRTIEAQAAALEKQTARIAELEQERRAQAERIAAVERLAERMAEALEGVSSRR